MPVRSLTAPDETAVIRLGTRCQSGHPWRLKWKGSLKSSQGKAIKPLQIASKDRVYHKPTVTDLGTHRFDLASDTFERPKSARDVTKALLNTVWFIEWKSQELPGPGVRLDHYSLRDQRDIDAGEGATYGSNVNGAYQ